MTNEFISKYGYKLEDRFYDPMSGGVFKIIGLRKDYWRGYLWELEHKHGCRIFREEEDLRNNWIKQE